MTAEEIATKTQDAYSYPRYRNWTACVRVLLKLGYDAKQAEYILRSKAMRRAADRSECDYGRVPASHLLRYINQLSEQERWDLGG